MLKFIFTSVLLASFIFANAQTHKDSLQVVEASCGQCQFNLSGKGCDLAVRIDGKAFYVDGTKIDDHGDAHAADGFCSAIRKALVKGEVVKGRYQATFFKLEPMAPKTKLP
jgi:uncharacterized protein YuzB (UPF0349 family)